MRRSLTVAVAAGLLSTLLVPGRVPVVAGSASDLTRAEQAGAWIAREAADGSLPGPTARTDWGLTVDALFALYASGVGESAANRMATEIESHAGAYIGPDLYRDKDVRLAGPTAALLNVAVVTGDDPRSYGHGRYARGGNAYDMRGEVLDLIASPRSKQPGRLQDRGTGSDSTNMFSQSLAVIGLARSGGGHEAALTFLRSQQCGAGYFRMFYNDGKSCSAAGGQPDIDGTAIATQALVAARASGTSGLDGAISRASEWLSRVQRPNGSFGGVGSSEPPNANSTGLAAQALHATGAKAAYRKARKWVAALQVKAQRAGGTQIAAEVGAFAYNPDSLRQARRSGIDNSARDQWRRASAQAVYALAPVPYGRLGAETPNGNPRVPEATKGNPEDKGDNTTPPPDRNDDQQDPPDDTDKPEKSPTPDEEPKSDDEPEPEPSESDDSTEGDATPEPTRPTERAASFIASRLVDGTHLEVRQNGTLYVDYDTTADAVIALRLLGERPDDAAAATKFLLRKNSVDAYVHGAPYEKGNAVYAESLAKLSLIAQWLPSGKRANELAAQLADLQKADGGFEDRGGQADRSMATRRQALASLALRAAGLDEAAGRAVDPLVAVQCADGSFAVDLTQTGCSTGDAEATGVAVQAINAVPAGDPVAQTHATAAANTAVAAPDHIDALSEAAGFFDADETQPDATVTSTRADLLDWSAVGALAAGRQALGLDATYIADRTGRLLRPDGGVGGKRHSDVEATVEAAPAIAGRSLLGTTGSPLAPGSRVPVATDDATQTTPAADDDQVVASWVVYGLAGMLALVLLLTCVLLVQRIIKAPEGSRT